MRFHPRERRRDPEPKARWVIPYQERSPVSARLCVIRKSEAATALAVKKLKRRANKHGAKLWPETLVYAGYVMVLTTFPESQYPAPVVLELYRYRWQIELVFKRFKSIAQLGHLPKKDEDSSHAWLYGKLLVALLTEKVTRQANAFSPWGYCLQGIAEPVA
jgi:IS4 transposase